MEPLLEYMDPLIDFMGPLLDFLRRYHGSPSNFVYGYPF